MRRTICFILLLLFIPAGMVSAFDFDFDDLFNDDLLIEVEETVDAKPEEALLVQDRVEVGGSYNLSFRASRTKVKGFEPEDSLILSLGGNLFLDYRPNPAFRLFAKSNYGVQARKDENLTSSLKLSELFADFTYDNKVFFRGGKQQAAWGVGYFFSPADVISVGRIDPQDPDQDLEGPLALKVHYPKGSSNYYTYLLFDGLDTWRDIAVAPKVEMVMGRSELGFGAYLQRGKVPRLMATLSSSLGDFGLFAEAVVSKGSDKGFVGELGLLDYPIREEDKLFFHATAGATYSLNDPDNLFNLRGAVQYYFNGEGYEDQKVIANFREQIFHARLFNPDSVAHVAQSDLSSTGRHYIGALLNWDRLLNTKLSLSGVLTANLSDRSGIFRSVLSLPKIAGMSPSVGVSFNYGDAYTEFGLHGERVTTVFAAVTIRSGSF